MWPQKKPFDPLAFLRVGNIVQPARGANTVQPQNQAPKPQQKPQLPSQFSALNRPTVQNQVQRTVNPNQQPQQQPVTAPFRQPAPQRIIAPAPVRSAMPQNTITPTVTPKPVTIAPPPRVTTPRPAPKPVAPQRNPIQQFGDFAGKVNDATLGTGTRLVNDMLIKPVSDHLQNFGEDLGYAVANLDPKVEESYQNAQQANQSSLDTIIKRSRQPGFNPKLANQLLGNYQTVQDQIKTNADANRLHTDPVKVVADGGLLALDAASFGKAPKFLPGGGATVKSGAALGGGFGLAYGGLQPLSDSGSNANPWDVAKSAGMGLAGGTLMGAAIPAIKPTYKYVKNAATAHAVQAGERASGLPKVNVLNDNEAYTLADWGDYLGKRDLTDTTNPKVVQEINARAKQAYHAAKNAGVDIQSGSARDIQGRIADYLERRDMYKQGYSQVAEGGSVPAGMFDPTGKLGKQTDVPKQDLIIRNGDGKAMSVEPKQPANAFQDTLPSKTRPNSIREIVKQGGNPLYHDTSSKGVMGILNDGEIKVSQAPFSQIAGQGKRVSTTRNFDNYSRYGKAPYRFIIDETKTKQKAIPDNREEFESIFKQNVKTDSIKSLAIDTTNPELIKDIRDGTLQEIITKAKEKGIRVEPFEGKILPDEYANKEIQQMTKDAFAKFYNPTPKPTLQDALAGKSTKIVYDAPKKIATQVQQSNTPVQAQSKSGQKLRSSQETLSRSSQQSGQKTPSPDSKARTGQTYTDNTPQAPYSKESLNRIQRALNPNDKLAYKNLTPVEKRLYQGEKAKQRVAKLEAKEQARLQNQAKVQQRQDTIDNAPEIDTKSYVKNMSKLQKESMKGDNGVRAKAADFKEKFIDDLAPIEDRLNKAIKNGTSIDPKDHITYQLDRSRRSEGITHAYIRDNGLDKIIQNVDNTNEFDQYLIARHAKELDPEITTGRNLAKDAALVRQLDGKYGEAAKQLYAYNQKLLDTSVDYGLISKETATALKKQYPEYVPFNRIFNEDELANLYGGSGKGNASISKQSAVQKIKGSKRAIASPLNSIIDKTRVVIEQGERNKAAEMLAGYRKLDGNPFNLKEIPSTETIGSRSTISFLDKGKKRVFETDKEIADAAKNMTRQDIGLWGRIAAIPARVLRGGATSANVGFAGANVVKDIIGAAINSRHPFYITDPDAFGKALAAALNHKGKYYQELMREGVAGTSFDMYRNPNKSSVGEVRSHKNLATRTAYNVTHPSQWYRTFEDTIGRSEDFGRALQYYSNKKGFEDKLGVGNKNATILAADQARSNSTNFFRHGSYGKGINLAIPYWNAGVQGARIGVNRIKDRPVQTLTKIGFVIAAPSAMIAMNNYGNDKNRQVMEDIPQYEKDGNIIIVGPDARKNEKTGKWEGVTKIPVPPQHIGIHKTIQDAVRASMTGEAFDLVGNLGRITEDYTTVNPTDVKAVASKYTPQGLKLVAEPLSNTNFFTGNKIVPDSQKNLPAADQYNDYTSGTAKTLGKLTNISPRQIDNAIRTGMGGAGQNLVYGVDNALAATGVIDKKDVKGENPINSITRRFSGAASISPSEKADKEFSKYRQEVMNSEEYKNASQYDKSRMLNRLQSDLEAVAYDKSGKSESKLSSKQQSLKDNGFDKSIYTNLDSKVKNTKDTGWTDEYNAAKSAYDKESSSWNPVEKEKKTKELRTLDVKRHYSKEATSLYDMNETDIYRFLDRQDEKKAQSYYKQIVEYGDKMVEAGLWSTNKLRDKNGNVQYERGYVAKNGKVAKSSGGRKTSSKSTGRKSTGRKSSGGSGGTSNASFAAILAAQKRTNDLANDTYGSLSKLLGGLAPKSQKRTIGQRAVTKKITVKGAKA